MTKLNQKWHDINWNKSSKYAKNLQKELVAACQYTLENRVPVHATCHESITYARKD